MRKVLGLALAGFACTSAFGYSEPTHADITSKAVVLSLGNSTTLKQIGLEYPVGSGSQTFPNGEGRSLSVLELFSRGSFVEDEFPRPLNHFFNPVDGSGLLLGDPTPDWALEGGLLQKYSYRDARDYFYKAMTSQTDEERKKNWGLTFQSLGQVLHLFQTICQPQHVPDALHPLVRGR